MELLEKNSYLKKDSYSFKIDFNIYFFLLIINFLAYSIYAVLSKYNIILVEIIIHSNFVIFFIFYKKYYNDKISFFINFNKNEIAIFFGILIFLLLLIFSELRVPLFGDEIAATRRATRTALFGSFFLVNILDFSFLKTIQLKYIIQLINLLQFFFILLIFYLIKKKSNILNLILILFITLFLRFLLKDGIHHPPLNHIFTTTFISFFGLNHIIVRLAYLIPFWFFLILLYKQIKNFLDEKTSIIFILCIATFPFLLIASVTPDHSIWSSFIFSYLLFYIFLKKNIDYRLCILIISVGILFRITVFSGFFLIAAVFFADFINKKFIFKEKIKFLILNQKIILIFLIFFPILFVSALGTPAFEGVEKLNPISYFLQAIESKVIFYSLIKQIPLWYYLFIIPIFFCGRKIEILIFFVINLIIYFSVKPGLWGNAKYVLEYGVPFFLLGHLIFVKYLFDKKKLFLINIINLIIIFLNVHDVYKFPSSRISSDLIYNNGYSKMFLSKDKNTKYFLKIPYSYDKAFDYIEKKNAKKNTLLFGTTYGFLPEILQNYNYSELIKVINLRNDFDNLSKGNYSLSKKINKLNESSNLKKILQDYLNMMKKTNIVRSNNKPKLEETSKSDEETFSKLNQIKNLKYILLADYGDRENIKKVLLSNNWYIVKEFEEENYRSTLLIFKKS